MAIGSISLQPAVSTRLRTFLYVTAFVIPLALNSQQIVTGTIVNGLLFITAMRLSRKDQLPVVILPSLGAVAHGVLFGPQTIFLYYFLPFIWLGNYVLTTVFSALHDKHFALRVVAASVAKYLLLYATALIYLRLRLVPPIFLIAMGILQLATALMGGLLSYGAVKLTAHYDRR